MRFVAKLILSKIYAHLGVKNWTEISIRHYKCLYIRKGPPESTQDGMFVYMETCCSDTCCNWCIDEHVKDSLVKIWSILGPPVAKQTELPELTSGLVLASQPVIALDTLQFALN